MVGRNKKLDFMALLALLHYKGLTHLARFYGLWWCNDIFSYHQLCFYCLLQTKLAG